MDVADISAFAKSLREHIGKLDHKPSHLEMLNLVTLAGGYRNFQHFRSTFQRQHILNQWRVDEDAPPSPPNAPRVKATLRVFSAAGRIMRWPRKRSQQELCLWYLWSQIPLDKSFDEREISRLLDVLHMFGDSALLRRDLVDLGLMHRNRDGSNYRRVDKAPPGELALLCKELDDLKIA